MLESGGDGLKQGEVSCGGSPGSRHATAHLRPAEHTSKSGNGRCTEPRSLLCHRNAMMKLQYDDDVASASCMER